MSSDLPPPDQPAVAVAAPSSTPSQAEGDEAKPIVVEFPAFHGFDHERRTYAEHKSELLRDYEGQQVVIKGDEILGVWPSYEGALEAGYARYGLEQFYVKEILKEDPVIWITRFVLPCPA